MYYTLTYYNGLIIVYIIFIHLEKICVLYIQLLYFFIKKKPITHQKYIRKTAQLL